MGKEGWKSAWSGENRVSSSSSLSWSSSSSFIFKTSIFPHSARVRRSSRNDAPPHIPEHCPFMVQTKHLHIIHHTFMPSFSPSTRTSHPCHHHISTGRHPIIPILTFHMPKPPQSTPPHQRSVHPEDCQIHTGFPIFQRHSAHPSHHHSLCSLQTLQIRFLHRPGFTPICQCTLDSSLSLNAGWCTPGRIWCGNECVVWLKDRRRNADLYRLLGVPKVADVVMHGRLRWFEYLESEDGGVGL